MEISKVVVIGTGAMGSGIAYVSAVAGYKVSVIDQNQELADKGLDRIKQKLKKGIERGKLKPAEAEKISQNLSASVDLATEVADAQLVIEAVYENMDVKKEIFRQLNEHALENAILASNTSTLSISEMAEQVKNPSRVIGMHFFNPPEAMKLVEVVIGEETSDKTKEIALSYVERIGKEQVISKDSPGFIVNRISVPVLVESLRVLDEGIATKEDIDKAMKLGMNYPIGPIALADYVGLDVSLAAIQTLEREFGEHYKPSPTLKKLVEEGKLGVKTGEGFYKYR